MEHEQQEPSQNDRHKAQLHPVRKRPADISATKWKKRRNAITEPFQSFREIEIRKAAEELPKGKAPGPDALPGELFQRLPAILPLLKELATAIVRTGNIPQALRLVHIVPLEKPGKDEQSCESKRPISLINATIKIIEYAVYNRIIHGVEDHYHPSHCGYRRLRGTDTHLKGLIDSIENDLHQGHHIYLASLDIQAASIPYHTWSLAKR